MYRVRYLRRLSLRRSTHLLCSSWNERCSRFLLRSRLLMLTRDSLPRDWRPHFLRGELRRSRHRNYCSLTSPVAQNHGLWRRQSRDPCLAAHDCILGLPSLRVRVREVRKPVWAGLFTYCWASTGSIRACCFALRAGTYEMPEATSNSTSGRVGPRDGQRFGRPSNRPGAAARSKARSTD